ncbi:MAG: hypothetical protein ACJ76P_10180 [Actinomycetota bacterium]
MRRRLRGGLALSTAGLAVALYLFGVVLSGHGGPIAQRPMFDGSSAIIPYHWVCPPKALTPTNQKPTSAETTVRLGPKGSAAKTMQSTDGQIYFVMRARLFPPHPGAHTIDVQATPQCTSKAGPLPNGLTATGNMYQVTATYEPGGDPVTTLAFSAVGILVYPVQPTLHTTGHTLLLSPDAKTWQSLDSTDVPGLVQVQGSVPSLGYLIVGQHQEALTTGTPSSSAPSSSSSSGGFPNAWLLVVGAVVILALAFAAYSRSRRRSG